MEILRELLDFTWIEQRLCTVTNAKDINCFALNFEENPINTFSFAVKELTKLTRIPLRFRRQSAAIGVMLQG